VDAGTPITWPLQHEINGVLLGALVGIGLAITLLHGGAVLIIVFAVGALILGVLSVLPVGGADMPVIIALLNSFTGIAAAVTGFVLGNDALIVAGALVGASGSILTMLMSKAMNRPSPTSSSAPSASWPRTAGRGQAPSTATSVRPTSKTWRCSSPTPSR